MEISHRDLFCDEPPAGGMGGPTTGYYGLCSTVIDAVSCEGAGPSTATVVECFESVAELELTGTRALAGYSESLQGGSSPNFFPLGIIGGADSPTGGAKDGQVDLTPLPGAPFGRVSHCNVVYQLSY